MQDMTISYIDTQLPREVRRAKLEERYFFTCLCPPCLGEEVACPPRLARMAVQELCLARALQEEVGEEHRHLLASMLCQSCGGAVAPREGEECAGCGELVTARQEQEYREAERAVTVLLRSRVMSPGAAVEFMDLLSPLLHPCHLARVRCCQAALSSCVLRGEVGAALEWGDQLLEAARSCFCSYYLYN